MLDAHDLPEELRRLVAEAHSARHQSRHLAVAYRHRATELTKWSRARDAVGLGVAPAVALVVIPYTAVRAFGLAVSGLLSLGAWLWKICDLAYHLEEQLKVSLTLPARAEAVASELGLVIGRFQDATPQGRADTAHKLRDLIAEAGHLRQEVTEKQVHVAAWQNLMAQQEVLREQHAECAECGSCWRQGQKILTIKQARALCRRAEKNKPLEQCPRCGQDR